MRNLLPFIAAALLLPACATARTNSRQRPMMVVIGDSVAEGYGVKPSEAFPALLTDKINERGWPIDVVLAAHTGDTVREAYDRNIDVLKKPCDMLVVELGANDAFRRLPPDETQKDLERLLSLAYKQNRRLRILIIGFRSPAEWGDYSRRFNAIFPRIAFQYRTAYLPFVLDDVVSEPALTLADHIHPNVLGHQQIAQRVWEGLDPILRKILARYGIATAAKSAPKK
ncbi:MAG: hypothetical protein JO102_04465 [Elusimicrobia bacterium]|nr:hypothetical protein [Elusimicrobiota bacterium]